MWPLRDGIGLERSRYPELKFELEESLHFNKCRVSCPKHTYAFLLAAGLVKGWVKDRLLLARKGLLQTFVL